MELIKSFNYKKLLTFTLTFFLMIGLSHAKKADKIAVKTGNQIQTETPKLKKILLQLIKQNEHMDDVLDEMKDSGNNLSLTQISSLNLTLNIINKNLKYISLLTKEELLKIQPVSNNATYAKTILSYATKLDIKVYRAQKLVKKSLSQNSILRDAPKAMPVPPSKAYSRQTANSRKTKKVKAMPGAVSTAYGQQTAKRKSLLQIIKEQKATYNLEKNLKILKLASKKLHATSKWLFIVSK